MFLCVCPKKRRTEDTAIHWWNEGLEKCWKPQNFQYSPDMWGVVGVGLESLVRWSRSAKLGRDSMTMHFKFLQCLQYCSLTLQIGIAVFQEQVHLHIHIYSYYIYIYVHIFIYIYIYLDVGSSSQRCLPKVAQPVGLIRCASLSTLDLGCLPYPLCLIVRFDFMWLMPL